MARTCSIAALFDLGPLIETLTFLSVMAKVPSSQATDIAICVEVIRQLNGQTIFPIMCAVFVVVHAIREPRLVRLFVDRFLVNKPSSMGEVPECFRAILSVPSFSKHTYGRL